MLALLANAWAAYSFAATLIGAAGVLALVAAFVLTPYLPAALRHALFFGGALVVVCAVYGQAEHSRGAAAQVALDHARALAAEQKRADLAEAITHQDRQAAAQDLADEKARTARLKEALDALANDPHRNDACLTGRDARRLRDL